MSLRVPSFKNIAALTCEDHSQDIVAAGHCCRANPYFSPSDEGHVSTHDENEVTLDTLIEDSYLRDVVASIACARGATSIDFGSAKASDAVNIDYRDSQGRNALAVLTEIFINAANDEDVSICSWALCVIRGCLSIGVSADCKTFAGFTPAALLANWLYANLDIANPENNHAFCASFPFHNAFAPFVRKMYASSPSLAQIPSRSNLDIIPELQLPALPSPSSLALPATLAATTTETGLTSVSTMRRAQSCSVSVSRSRMMQAEPDYAVRRLALSALKALETMMYARYSLEPINRGNGASWH